MFSLSLVCQAGEETIDHVLWTCPFSRQCWEEVSLHSHNFDGQSTIQRLVFVFENWTNNDIGRLSMVSGVCGLTETQWFGVVSFKPSV